MRHFLISALLLSLVAGCSGGYIASHRIDVQQGNALDQENVARLKPGLNRSQVRFLLGTPLLVDPFRTDRWDYVYMYYTAGKLTEQKRITLFFEGDTLVRIEGDLPQPAEPPPAPLPTVNPASQAAPAAQSEATTEIRPAPVSSPPQATTLAQQPVEPTPQRPVETPAPQPVRPAAQQPVEASGQSAARPEPVAPAPPHAASEPAPRPAPAVAATAAPAATLVPQAPEPAAASIVSPLPSPKDAPAYTNKRPPAELSLQPATDVAQIQPDIIPPFPGVDAVPEGRDAAVLKSVYAWVDAWARRDEDTYVAAYDSSFVPQGGGSRADWEKRRRLLLGVAKNLEVRIEAPSVERGADGTAVVTINQYYRSDNYRDAVVKQLRLAEHDGRWLIVEEKVISVLRGTQP